MHSLISILWLPDPSYVSKEGNLEYLAFNIVDESRLSMLLSLRCGFRARATFQLWIREKSYERSSHQAVVLYIVMNNLVNNLMIDVV